MALGTSHRIYRHLQRVVGHVLTKIRGVLEYEVRKGGYSTFWEVEIDLCMSYMYISTKCDCRKNIDFNTMFLC